MSAPPELVALAGLPSIGPTRLRALVGARGPIEAFDALVAGRVSVDRELAAACGPKAAALIERWTAAARQVDLADLADRHRAAGVAILTAPDPAWPPLLAADPEPPALLFVHGASTALSARPSVAVVGTRQATRYGLEVARELGGALADAGVTVLSGLAAGIDGAAHAGALRSEAAPPVAIVGSGLDIVYPRGHRTLWGRVAAAGAVASEWPLGTRPTRWRFPARNRILAALSDVVVVVESPPRGGAMHTVEEALRRDRTVMAVPGPVTSRASQGTNRLLADGMAPACDPADVLAVLGLERATAAARSAPPAPAGEAGLVLDAVGWAPANLDQLVLRTGLSLEQVARAVLELEGTGWLASDGGWLERCR